MLLRLKVVESGKNLPVNLILNVIEFCLSFIGTHFDHNQNIIKILFIYLFIFAFPVGPWVICTNFGPPVGVAVT